MGITHDNTVIKLVCHLFQHIWVCLQLTLSFISLLKMSTWLVYVINFIRRLTRVPRVHNLQLGFGVIYCPVFGLRLLFVSWLVFEGATTTTEGLRGSLVDGFLIYCHWIWRVTFFVTNSSHIRLICGNFTLIVEMWVTLHILHLLLLLASCVWNTTLHSHSTTGPLFNIDSNITTSRLRNILNRCLFSIKNLFVMNISQRIVA